MRSTLTQGSLTGALQVIITTVLVLIAVPLFVRLRGTEAFGVFSLIAVVGNVNAFANLGLNASLVRSLSEQGHVPDADLDIAVTFLMLMAVIVPLSVVAFLLEEPALRSLLGVPPAFMGDARWLYRSMLISNILVLLGGTCTAVLDACERVHVTNVLQMIYSISYWGLILAVLLLGWPLAALGAATVAATILWFVAAVIGMNKAWGILSLTGIRERGLARARKQVAYGAQLFSAGVIGFFYEPLTKVLLAHFLGVGQVGIFDIGMRARNLVSSLALKALYPLYPWFSRSDDPDRMRSLVVDVEEKLLLISAPIPGLIILTAGPIVRVIFGAGHESITVTMIWLISSYILWSFTVLPMYVYLMARGHAAKTVAVQTVNVTVNALVFVTTYAWLGYHAVLMAIAASTLCSWLLLLVYQRRQGMATIFSARRVRWIVLSLLVASLALAWSLPLMMGDLESALVGCVAVCAASLVVYRLGQAFSRADIERYLGGGSRLAALAERILVRPSIIRPRAGGA